MMVPEHETWSHYFRTLIFLKYRVSPWSLDFRRTALTISAHYDARQRANLPRHCLMHACRTSSVFWQCLRHEHGTRIVQFHPRPP